MRKYRIDMAKYKEFEKFGYMDNILNYSGGFITADEEDGCFSIVKVIEDKRTAISLFADNGVAEVEVYKYEGKPHNHNRIRELVRTKNYILEIIEAGLLGELLK